MTSPVLTVFQDRFLRRFFASQAGRHFFLTGGTALSAFYFQHRRSLDLDLFTTDDRAMLEVGPWVFQVAGEIGGRVIRTRRTEFYRELILEEPGGLPLRVDLVRGFGPLFGERKAVEGIVVDSVENIAANKIAAILGRTEAKDFVDLYVVLQAGYSFEDLFAKAQQKDAGLLPFYFAGALLQVQHLWHLPELLKPLSLEELRTFFVALADRLLEQIRPEQPRSGQGDAYGR